MTRTAPRPLSAEDAGLCFRNDGNYLFAARRTVLPVGLHEVRHMVSVAPLALVKRANDWRLVADVALEGTDNLLVGPRGGWLAAYLPERLTLHPFTLTLTEDRPEGALAVVAESPRLFRGDEHRLLDDGGEPTDLYRGILDILKRHADGDRRVREIAGRLLDRGCLRPRAENVEKEEDAPRVYGIDAKALDELDGERAGELHELHASGGLALAYALYYSAGNLKKYRRMQARAAASPQEEGAEAWFMEAETAGFNFD